MEDYTQNVVEDMLQEDEEAENEVLLMDENGQEVRFDHLLTFFYEKEKYIALLPMEHVDGMEENSVLLLHVVTKDGEDVYETIESEVLLEEVFEEFLELFDEMVEQED